MYTRKPATITWLFMMSLSGTLLAQAGNGGMTRTLGGKKDVAPSAGAAVKTSATAVGVSAKNEAIELDIGEQKVIPSDNVQSYSEGVKGIADVRLTKDATQFVIVGVHEGTTTLLFLMTDGSERHYRIVVKDPNKPVVKEEEVKIDPHAVQARDNIRLDFYFVQINRKSGYQIGIGWPASVGPTLNASFNLQSGAFDSATVVVSDQALPRLDMGQSSGWAKIMRQAAVVTANREKAAFTGGGEVNIAVKSAMTTGIQKIPYGSQIEVEPRYDSKTGRVEMHLHADVSELDDDQGTGVPGRVTSTVDTVVNLEIGQSLILGGLTSKTERSSKTGIPLLSQIPILGVLFGSHAHAEAETENVVIIVPSVVDAVSMQDRERISNALHRYAEFSGDMEEGAPFVPESKSAKAPTSEAAARKP